MSIADKASQDPGGQEKSAEQLRSEKSPDQLRREKSPEQLRRDIEATREQLGDTVEALAEKTDLKAQAKRRVDSLRGAARQKRNEVKAKASAATPESTNSRAQQVVGAAKQNPAAIAGAGAFVAGLLLGRWTR